MNANYKIGLHPDVFTFLLIMVYACTFLGRQIISIMIEPIKLEFGASDSAIGAITGVAFGLVYAFFGLYSGRVLDRYRRVTLLSACLLSWAIAMYFSAFAGSLVMLASGRMVVAAMESATTPASLSLISDLYPPSKRILPITFYSGAPTISIIVGLSFGAWVINSFGWRSGFLVASLPVFIFSIIMFFVSEPDRGRWEANNPGFRDSVSLFSSIKDIFGNRLCFLLVMSTTFGSFCAFSFVMWNTPFLVRVHGLNLQDAGIIVGLVTGFTALLGSVFIGWFSGLMMRHGVIWLVRIPIIGNTLNLFSTIIYLMSERGVMFDVFGVSVPSAIFWCIAAGFFSAFWLGPTLTLLSSLVSHHERSTTFAFQNISGTLAGVGLGPLVVGVLSDLLTPIYGEEAIRYSLVIVSALALFPIVMLLYVHMKFKSFHV